MPFAIGIENSKMVCNLGTLMRSAYNFNASMVFTVGRRYKRQASDTVASFRHIPVMNFASWDEYAKHSIMMWEHIAVELTSDSQNIRNFIHPKSCVYILGPEDGSVSKRAMDMCKYKIQIPSRSCLNVSIAGSIIMYDRMIKCE